MGLFGSLFEKKTCGACGKELGLLGKQKLEDGYLCKDCCNLLSPFFCEHRQSTVEEIKGQLAYREANRERVATLNITRTLGRGTRLLLDEDARCFVVTSAGGKWRDENPDVIGYEQVTGCIVDVRETKSELMRELEDGTEESYDPPRYDTYYDVFAVIRVNSPYFAEIELQLNDCDEIKTRYCVEFEQAKTAADEICELLSSVREELRDAAAAAQAPRAARSCPACGATTFGDEHGCCEYCGSALTRA